MNKTAFLTCDLRLLDPAIHKSLENNEKSIDFPFSYCYIAQFSFVLLYCYIAHLIFEEYFIGENIRVQAFSLGPLSSNQKDSRRCFTVFPCLFCQFSQLEVRLHTGLTV